MRGGTDGAKNAMKLESTLGHTIGHFCTNGFANPADNHCAHYVGHVLAIDTGYDCRTHTGKAGQGASLRVHELFAHCPRVGRFEDAPPGICVVFVTATTNVDLPAQRMRNVPQKHVGLYDGTHVYHYSNGQDQAIRQTPAEFLARFEALYAGEQALYFGTLPPEAQVPESDALPLPDATAAFAHTLPTLPRPRVRYRAVNSGKRTDYYATLDDGSECYLGRRTRYQGRMGLAQPASQLTGPVYAAQDYTALYGAAAAMVGVISASESAGRFNRLNSYDRAAFTFGFFQLAAHTPDDNLILLFRRLAAGHPGFQQQFPDLLLQDGRLHRRQGTAATSLEREYPRPGKPDELILKDFMAYLNPDDAAVDDSEIDTAARLVALANDPAFNAIQVNVATEITMAKLRRRYDPWYTLDGQPDLICTAIADIHHQGRGTKTQVRAALKLPTLAQQLEALCRIGEARYPERCQTLKTALEQAREDQLLGQHVFDRASGLFRAVEGWDG